MNLIMGSKKTSDDYYRHVILLKYTFSLGWNMLYRNIKADIRLLNPMSDSITDKNATLVLMIVSHLITQL